MSSDSDSISSPLSNDPESPTAELPELIRPAQGLPTPPSERTTKSPQPDPMKVETAVQATTEADAALSTAVDKAEAPALAHTPGAPNPIPAKSTTTPAQLSDIPRASPTLEGLPHELQVEICKHITLKEHLRNVCLTSRKLQQAAVVSMYRDVVLDVTKASRATAMMMCRENPGLEHVRDLKLAYHASTTDNNSEGGKEEGDPGLLSAREVAIFLMNGIPRDKLRSFSWDSGVPLKPSLFSLLLKRQHQLRHLEVGTMGHDEGTSLEKEFSANPHLLKAVSNVCSIQLYPDCMDCFGAARMIMEKTKPITRLGISAANIPDGHHSTINDDGTTTDPLFSAAFNHLRQPMAKPMMLVELALEKIDLSHCRRTYSTVMCFEKLKRLRIRHCTRPDLFLDALVNPGVGLPARVAELNLLHDEPDGERLMIPALDRFLGYFKGLEKLEVGVINDGALPAIGTITRHGDTLTELYLSIWRNPAEGGKYKSWSKQEDLQRLFSGLPKLKQLAMPFHGLTPLLDFKADCDFKSICIPAMTLPSLVTLNILNYPSVQHFDLKLKTETYRALCRLLATEILFEFGEAQREHCGITSTSTPTTPGGTLQVLVFGEHDDFDKYAAHLTGLLNPAELKRLSFVRMRGREHWHESDDTPMAVTIEDEQLRGLELPTGILDCDFKFRLEAPVGED